MFSLRKPLEVLSRVYLFGLIIQAFYQTYSKNYTDKNAFIWFEVIRIIFRNWCQRCLPKNILLMFLDNSDEMARMGKIWKQENRYIVVSSLYITFDCYINSGIRLQMQEFIFIACYRRMSSATNCSDSESSPLVLWKSDKQHCPR